MPTLTLETIHALLAEKLPTSPWQLDSVQQEQLTKYLALLHEWNQAFNLIRFTDLTELMVKHIFDSLVIAPYLHGERVLDVGSGAGLPGIPLAIIEPDRQFVLLDSNGKKTRFLWQVQQDLQLANLTIVQARVENYLPAERFHTITARAFSSLNEFIEKSRHVIDSDGKWLAMKGGAAEKEVAELPEVWQKQASIHQLNVPELEAKRQLVIINASKEQG